MVHQITTPSSREPRSPAAISVQHLTKRYGVRAVVDDLTFDVAPGEVFALLGPNGAGKTTTIEILEGYRSADSGTESILGLDPGSDNRQLRRRDGLMLQQGGFYPTTTPREALQLFASFYEKPTDPDTLLRRVGLESAARTLYRQLSGGEKQRMSLAVELVGQPELVFLDEPTAGMDPQARRVTWDIIGELRGRGVTFVLTTHLIDEAERLADRIGIIDNGRLIALGSPTGLTATAYERYYGVLKRLGGSPLPRWGLLLAKALAVFGLEVFQVRLVISVAVVGYGRGGDPVLPLASYVLLAGWALLASVSAVRLFRWE
jgi:ABC-2 type transport system ATP-binding protein